MKYTSLFGIMVRINGYDWRIKFTRDKRDLMRSDGVVTLGVTDRNDFTIYLFDGLKGDLLQKVIIHELTHAFIFSYGFYLTLEEEEFVCSFLDTYARDIIREADYMLKSGLRSMLYH